MAQISYAVGFYGTLAVIAFLVLWPVYQLARAFWRGLRGKSDKD